MYRICIAGQSILFSYRLGRLILRELNIVKRTHWLFTYMLIYSLRLTQNWYTKAPSGGLQQHYLRHEMEQLQITKPGVLDSTENLREGARPSRYRTM